MIAAVHPCSFVDFPGRVAAVAFTQGCDLRCRYCHNPDLCRPPATQGPDLRQELMGLLARRRNRLGGVVITGGEPSIHPGLAGLLREARDLDFATSGSVMTISRTVAERKVGSMDRVSTRGGMAADETSIPESNHSAFNLRAPPAAKGTRQGNVAPGWDIAQPIRSPGGPLRTRRFSSLAGYGRGSRCRGAGI